MAAKSWETDFRHTAITASIRSIDNHADDREIVNET